MARFRSQTEFNVNVMVQVAGPVRPRTKYKENKLLRAEARIMLPFVPFPGLYLTFSKTKQRARPLVLYLRIRTVEWAVTEHRFECVADEMLGSHLFSETHEVRGSARIEKHFVELQKTLSGFGFFVDADADGMMALHKSADGTVIGPFDR